MKVKVKQIPVENGLYGAGLLASRGVDAQKILNPSSENLQCWEGLENIYKAVELIDKLPQNARIGLVVDCDCDGYTSSAVFYLYMQKARPDLVIEWYLHRGKAHGLEEHWTDLLDVPETPYDLIVLPDAGSNDGEYAKHFECPILVLDHHLVEEGKQAPNMLIVNNQSSPNYKNKDLSGVGITWQFCRAYDYQHETTYSNDLIDLVALGVCADMMSGLELENQYIWHQGFSNIKNYFFLSLARKQAYSITGTVAPSDEDIMRAMDPMAVAFYIVPLINAMIRVGSLEEKSRMFQAFIDGHHMIPSQKRGAKGTLEEVAVESARECTNARTHQNKFKDEAVARLEQKIFKHDLLENKVLFVRLDDDDDFPPELNGLVAMQLAAKYKRPTIVARLNDEGYIRGSIRGAANSELLSFKNFLQSTGLFEYVQGHDNAAGMSIRNKDLTKFHEIANELLADYDFNQSFYEADFECQALSSKLPEMIKDLAQYKHVWSQKNDEPLIYVTDLHFTHNDIQVMGKNKDTLKIFKNGVAYMKFFAKDLIQELQSIEGDIKVEVVGKANLNVWGSTVTPQIFIEAIEVKEDSLLDF